MPNALAYVALASWPLVALAVYATRRGRASVARTTAWMMVLPLMFLPARLELKIAPGIPFLDKHRMAFLAIALCLALFHPRPGSQALKAHRFARLLLLAMLLGVVQTVRTNGDALVYGPTILPGLSAYDGLSMAAMFVLDIYLPFAVGERVFRTERDVRDLFQVLAASALVYAPLAVVELVLSPQLHRWIYGYHQHEFVQAVRGTGFRPMLFMNHGLSVGMFFFVCLQAALALARTRDPARPASRMRALVAGAMLLLCKSLAAILYGIAGSAMQLGLSLKRRARAVVLMAAVVVAYPTIRAIDLVPQAEVVQLFRRISGERAESLLYRFEQEQQLLARARLRPVFGWGSWGRNHIWAPWGGRISVTDGEWIILLGAFGYVGFLGFFALLIVPLVRFARNRRFLAEPAGQLIGALALIVAFSTVDLLPNARSDFLPVAFAGALYAVSGRLGRRASRPRSGDARAAGAARGAPESVAAAADAGAAQPSMTSR